MRALHLFAGAGGGILGGMRSGWTTVCAVEINDYCQRLLMQRQDDGRLDPFPIWGDVRTFDGLPWRGLVDVIAGGFPCQDISSAGTGKGIAGDRSGLWSEFARIIREVQPRFVFVENSPMLTQRGLGVVLGSMAKLGMHGRWGVLSSAGTGGNCLRKRLWIVAYAPGERLHARDGQAVIPAQTPAQAEIEGQWVLWDFRGNSGRIWRAPESIFTGVDYTLAEELDRLKAIGNGQDPYVAAAAWAILGGPVT